MNAVWPVLFVIGGGIAVLAILAWLFLSSRN